MLLAGMGVGGLVGFVSLFQEIRHQLPAEAGKLDLTVTGTVVSVPAHDDRLTRFLFRVDQYERATDNTTSGLLPVRLRLSWYSGARHAVSAGDRWRFNVRLKPASSLGNPGGFNYERWLFQHRIHATGYVRDSPPPEQLNQTTASIHSMRESIANRLAKLPSAGEQVSLVQGLTVGITSGISVDQWQTLRHSGTAHLLAISGLHIGLISGWFLFSAGWLWRLRYSMATENTRIRITRPVFSWCVSFLGAGFYAALAGFSLPTQRALIMLGVLVVTIVLRRFWPPGSALLVALLLVLVVEPLSVLSVGFWLSFGTVAAIFYLYKGWLSCAGRKTGALLLHLKLGVVLLPATAWFFQQGSLIAPIANAFAVPVVGFLVVPLSFITVLLLPVWSYGANALLMLNQWVLALLLAMLDWLLLLPASSLPLFVPGPLILACTLLGLLVLFSPRALKLRWLAVPLIAPVIVLNVYGKPVRGLQMHVLDVGQGLSAVLMTENHTVLFDTGKKLSNKVTMFDRVVRPFLISQGRSSIDVAVISHGDDDHAGGVDALLTHYPNVQLFASDQAHIDHLHADACVAGKSFVFDDVTFSFIHPAEDDLGSDNNLSCVLLVHYGRSRIVIAGDIETQSERLLIDRLGERLPVSVLIAPHHGSRSSSSDAFVSTLPSDVVIFAAGEHNKFGFPHPEVIQRYRESGSKLFNTGEHGALNLQFNKQGLSSPVEWFWHNRRRYRR